MAGVLSEGSPQRAAPRRRSGWSRARGMRGEEHHDHHPRLPRPRLNPPGCTSPTSADSPASGCGPAKLRAALSALGIAIGVAAIVAVLGLSASSSAGLRAEISKLGTNLLTVTNGQNFAGGTAELPAAAPAMISRLPGVTQVQDTCATGDSAYRSLLIPANALSAEAASLGLPRAVGTTIVRGAYLNAGTAREPVAVLGAAAQRLGIDRIYPGERIWLGGQWFYLAGTLRPAVLAPRNRLLRADRLPRRAALPRLRRPALHDISPRPDQLSPRPDQSGQSRTTSWRRRPTPRTRRRSTSPGRRPR
jgi:MacB-like periplasmic core domain